jgi:hypothetical protein
VRSNTLFIERMPLMNDLEQWREQIKERKVEPNSGLGEAIGYMRTHWSKLTLFLRVPARRSIITFASAL